MIVLRHAQIWSIDSTPRTWGSFGLIGLIGAPWTLAAKIRWIANNSAAHCQMVLKFGRLHTFLWASHWKSRTIGGTGASSDNAALFIYLFANIEIAHTNRSSMVHIVSELLTMTYGSCVAIFSTFCSRVRGSHGQTAVKQRLTKHFPCAIRGIISILYCATRQRIRSVHIKREL